MSEKTILIMDENETNVEPEEESVGATDVDTSSMDNDELKNAVNEQLGKIRRQSILVGAQTACRVIQQKIFNATHKPGKMSFRDYKRLVDEINEFCSTGLSREVNIDGETTPKEEVQE